MNCTINTPQLYLYECIKAQQTIAQQVAELPWCECNCSSCQVCCHRHFLVKTQELLQATGLHLRKVCDELEHNLKTGYKLLVNTNELKSCSCESSQKAITPPTPFAPPNSPIGTFTPTTSSSKTFSAVDWANEQLQYAEEKEQDRR